MPRLSAVGISGLQAGEDVKTTVMIATQGNKEVAIQTPNGRMVLPPGRWFSLGIHGDQTLTIHETGGFVDSGPGVRFEEVPAAASAATES